MRTQHPTALEKLVTFIVAVVPATLMQTYTVIGLVFSISAIFQGGVELLLLAIWCAAGIFGALALWGIMFSCRSSWVAFGLIAGFLAILPVFGFFSAGIWRGAGAGAFGAGAGELMSLVWTIGLPLSAIYWLFRIDWSEPDDDPLLLEYHPDEGHSDLL